ncbi:hypothetical protein [Streptomyces sp. NBC_00503]|uniref:hypothetical protein n=1 Tax=Streptomyces sp. NBC_00503 TaxID=2903659 RepID=UPI002E82331A|nr:hypothetical protein [Streptomyces sp. NBC_00503]WUD86408.1 hypothetical protein OG490_37995 [Streptomyces sp. NBC_00503]
MTALLKLYPAAYRREFGDEIADAYHRATEGSGRPARIREANDVIGHALRMRLGVGSAGRAGRFLSALAPFAVIVVGVKAMSWSRLMIQPFGVDYPVGAQDFPAVTVAASLVTVLGAVLALTGRWATGAWTVLAGTAATLAAQAVRPGFGLEFAAVISGPPLLLALVAVACPPDLRPASRLRTATGRYAVLAGAAVLTAATVLLPLPHPFSALYAAVPVAGGLILAGSEAFARLRTAPAVLLAGLPFLVLGASTGGVGALFLPAALGALLAASATVSIRRRRGGAAR